VTPGGGLPLITRKLLETGIRFLEMSLMP